MREPTRELAVHALFEIVLMVRNVGCRRLRQLNARAGADGVNLRLWLEDAEERTRE